MREFNGRTITHCHRPLPSQYQNVFEGIGQCLISNKSVRDVCVAKPQLIPQLYFKEWGELEHKEEVANG